MCQRRIVSPAPKVSVKRCGKEHQRDDLISARRDRPIFSQNAKIESACEKAATAFLLDSSLQTVV
jgi:hypothetical protein